jgi:hypothetical protein
VRWRLLRTALLFDYLVDAREQRWRHGDPERLGSPKIDDRREFGGLFDWNVAGLGT